MIPCDVSAIITCFNKEQYLDECVNSVLRQSKHVREILVIHDGCEAPTHHAEATSIFLNQNFGVSNARNEGFRFSKGRLILFIDGDDVISPDYIQKMVLKIVDGVDVTYPDLYFWNPEGDSSLSIYPEIVTPTYVYDFEKVGLPITSLMRREVFEKVGGFRDLPVLEDLDFWLRVMCNGYKIEKANTLLWYRQIGNTRNGFDYVKKKEIFNKILAQFKRKEDKLWEK